MTIAIARQPILDSQRTLYGYEFLFRDGFDNALNALNVVDGTAATSQVISNSILMFGFDALTGGRKGFINVTRDVLLQGHIHLLPADTVIPEIPSALASDEDVVRACLKLKESGFQIALDDLRTDSRGALLEIADVVKVDSRRAVDTQQRQMVDRLRARGVKLIADKVEDYDQFGNALDLGYDYFQGFFFARPETLSRHEIPASKKQHLDLLQQISQPTLSFDQLNRVIKLDISLTYRLLRYLNSAAFTFRAEIGSVRQALVLLGEDEIRRWATLISLATVGEDKPSELLQVALTRARFLEMFAAQVGEAERAQDLFLLGLFSLLDAVSDQSFDRCLQGMPLDEPIVDALTGKAGRYRQLLELTEHYERGAWSGLAQAAGALSISPAKIPEFHLAASRWARQALQTATQPTTAGHRG